MFLPVSSLSPEIWVLVFRQLTGDYATLCRISLVCHGWRTLCLPCLLHTVDLSSHNVERRLTEFENSALPVVYSFHHAKYRPRNLVPRQRSFLRLIIAKPALASLVRSFTWTFVWRDTWGQNDHAPLLDIHRKIWNVFESLVNVTELDLASIHDFCDDDVVRETPAWLFPKVTDLRLLGWMNRGLVKAILTSVDSTKLCSLKLDFLEDPGNLPDGYPMNLDLAADFSKNARRANIADQEQVIDDRLFECQESGDAAVFPGPMWYPMRLLSSCSLDSLSHLKIAVPHFDMDIDLRNYYTTFFEAARLLRSASSSLRSLVVIFGESLAYHHPLRTACGTSRIFVTSVYKPWCIKMASTFLRQLLVVLSECQFPHLTQLTFEGFHLLEDEGAGPDLGGTLSYIRKSRFNDVNFTETQHLDGRLVFGGYECDVPEIDEEIMLNS